MPTFIQELGIGKNDYLLVGVVSMIPWGFGAIAMVLAAWNSDRTGDRRWHAIGASLTAMAGLLLLALMQGSPVVTVIALGMVAGGGLVWLAVFWTLPTAFLSGLAAAGGIAWINALSQLGGFVGPDVLGRIRGAHGGDNTLAFILLAVIALLVTLLTYLLSRTGRSTAFGPSRMAETEM